MIDLDLSDEQLAVRDVARSLATDLVGPAAKAAERDGSVPPAVWATLSDSGLTFPVPGRHGGGGVPDGITQLLAAEELGAGDAGIALAALWAGAGALLVALCGTARQQDDFFAGPVPAPDGADRLALYEGYGRSPADYRTRITAHPDGWSVTGTKLAVATSGPAGRCVVVGLDDQARLRVVVAADGQPGVSVDPAPEHGHLALAAARLRTARLDAVVPAGAVLGSPGGDDGPALAAVSRLRLLPAAVALGSARRAVEYAADYANERQAFGRAIAGFQGVSFLLAEAAIRVAATRLELWDVAARLDHQPREVRHAEVGQAVTQAGLVAAETTRDALQVLGGHGFITDHPVERWYRSTAMISALDHDPVHASFAPAL